MNPYLVVAWVRQYDDQGNEIQPTIWRHADLYFGRNEEEVRDEVKYDLFSAENRVPAKDVSRLVVRVKPF